MTLPPLVPGAPGASILILNLNNSDMFGSRDFLDAAATLRGKGRRRGSVYSRTAVCVGPPQGSTEMT